MKTVSDVTVGTVIVLVHVALAEREHADRTSRSAPQLSADGTRIWKSQISP